jgi:hypothetical protein
MPTKIGERLRLPSRVALLLGLSALSTTGVQAHTRQPASASGPDALSQERLASDQLRLWSDGKRLYVSERGATEVLDLGDSAEARHLHRLLQEQGTAMVSDGMRFDRIILAGGGGDGFHWTPVAKGRAGDNSAMNRTTLPSKPKAGNQAPAPSADPIGARKTGIERSAVKG